MPRSSVLRLLRGLARGGEPPAPQWHHQIARSPLLSAHLLRCWALQGSVTSCSRHAHWGGSRRLRRALVARAVPLRSCARPSPTAGATRTLTGAAPTVGAWGPVAAWCWARWWWGAARTTSRASRPSRTAAGGASAVPSVPASSRHLCALLLQRHPLCTARRHAIMFVSQAQEKAMGREVFQEVSPAAARLHPRIKLGAGFSTHT